MTSGRPKKTTGNVMMDELLKLTGKRKLKPTMPTSKQCDVHPCKAAPVVCYRGWSVCEEHDKELKELRE